MNDAGLEGKVGIEPVSVSEVVQVMNDNNERVRRLIPASTPAIFKAVESLAGWGWQHHFLFRPYSF